MPQTQCPPYPEATATAGEPTAVRETRFDPPHEVARGETVAPAAESVSKPITNASPSAPAAALLSPLPHDDIFAALEGISPELIRQFRTHAQQLAAHLEARQRDLDRREAELHAKLAKHETASRSARLWFQEQHRSLLQRQSEWERRERELASRFTSAVTKNWQATGRVTSTADAGADAKPSDSPPDETMLREIDLKLDQAEFHELSAQLEARRRQCDALAEKLEIQRQHLEAAETMLARGQAELDFSRKEFHAQREEHAAQMHRQRRQLMDDRARLESEFSQRRNALDQQTSQLESRSAAVEQKWAELLHLQRETLEMQLATEELRAELAGKAPPGAIAQSLARLRAKLAEQYHAQADDLATRRQQLESLAIEVAEQRQQFASEKREFEQWTINRQREIEAQAAQLMAREEELQVDQQQRENRQLQCEADRREMQAEIRRLQSQLRRLEADALELI